MGPEEPTVVPLPTPTPPTLRTLTRFYTVSRLMPMLRETVVG
jgi:hypothetical protein